MDDRFCAFGAVGCSIIESQTQAGRGLVNVTAAIRSILRGIQQYYSASGPIIMDRRFSSYVPEELRDGLLLIDDTELPPAKCWCIDVSVAAAELPREEFALSAALLRSSGPRLSMIIAPSIYPYPFAAKLNGDCYFFNGNHQPIKWRIPDRCLWRTRPELLAYSSLPAAAVRVMTTPIPYEIVPNTHPWEAAAGVLIVQEAGGDVAYRDGSQISWDCLDLPPLVFAKSRNVADRARIEEPGAVSNLNDPKSNGCALAPT